MSDRSDQSGHSDAQSVESMLCVRYNIAMGYLLGVAAALNIEKARDCEIACDKYIESLKQRPVHVPSCSICPLTFGSEAAAFAHEQQCIHGGVRLCVDCDGPVVTCEHYPEGSK